MSIKDSALVLFFVTSLFSGNAMAQEKKQMVRLALIEADTKSLREYNEFLKEEIEASIQKEPGVITLLAVAEKEKTENVTLFETYADSSQYKAHLTTPHFQKYKQGTLQMVKHLELIEAQPILYERKATLSKAKTDALFIRLIKIELNTDELTNFTQLAQQVMLPGLKTESGVLVMYAVSEKKDPSQISILEVYENKKAYEKHLKTTHFLKYKEQSSNMIKSLKLIDATPILLGAKLN